MSITCPKCWRTSYHPTDEAEGYCGNCHEFTGRPDGDQRHSSSSTPAGQERKMRMPTNDEDGKAQPEMPEMQREGNCPGLQQLRWEWRSLSIDVKRMEPNHEQDVRAMQRTRVSRASGDPIAMPPMPDYPSKFRYLSGATGMGISLGISWTLALTNTGIQRYLSRAHALMILFATVGFFFGWQVMMLVRWRRELKKQYPRPRLTV